MASALASRKENARRSERWARTAAILSSIVPASGQGGIGPDAFTRVITSYSIHYTKLYDGCIIVISRSEPHRSMARMRANRTMEVISWNELRLSLEETAELVKQWGKKLSAVALRQLYEKTA